MAGGIGAALVILLVVAAGAILYRYICVSYSFWSIIFYIKFLLAVVTGVLSSTLLFLLVVVAGVLSSTLFVLLVVVVEVLSSTLIFASCGSWSIILYINIC